MRCCRWFARFTYLLTHLLTFSHALQVVRTKNLPGEEVSTPYTSITEIQTGEICVKASTGFCSPFTPLDFDWVWRGWDWRGFDCA